MIKNPVQLRLAKLPEWQQRLFMVCLCERMYPNVVSYCQLVDGHNISHINDNSSIDKSYRNMLDLVWESLLIKEAKINFDLQIEKLEELIPIITDDSPYMIYPAIDAFEALGELLHSYLSNDVNEHTEQVSSISATTVAEFEMTKMDKLLSPEEQKQLPEVIEEFDLQWEIFRLLRNEKVDSHELIRGLKTDIRAEQTSNIGVFLGN